MTRQRRRVGHVNLKVPPDYWEVTVYLGRDSVTNKRRYKSRCLRGSRKDAERALAKLTVESGAADGRSRSSITTGELVGEYISTCRSRDLSPTTIEGYESIARCIDEDGLGGQRIDRLGARDLDKYYARVTGRGCKPATARRHHSLLHSALEQACRWSWLDRNPADLATPPAERRRKTKLPKSSIVGALVREAACSRNPANALAIQASYASSGRRGELCDRRWTDLDSERRLLWIHGSIAQLAGGRLLPKDTKDYADRTIVLDAITVEALRAHRADQERIAVEHGVALRHDAYIFANQNTRHGGAPDGSVPSRPSRLTQAFRRIRDRVPGAENLRLHDLRHLSASQLIADGESLPNVAQRLGHHVETLSRRYAHATDASVAAIDDLIGAATLTSLAKRVEGTPTRHQRRHRSNGTADGRVRGTREPSARSVREP